MKKILMAVFSLVIIAAIGVAVFRLSGPEKYGQAITDRNLTQIKDILANPKGFEGKTVTVNGQIANECSTGCWFFVQIGSGNLNIYVDTQNAGFAIPQKAGKSVLVQGTVIIKKTGPAIEAQGVEIK
jgi:aspartyl/asparaginyl-tRNA synthetase